MQYSGKNFRASHSDTGGLTPWGIEVHKKIYYLDNPNPLTALPV